MDLTDPFIKIGRLFRAVTYLKNDCSLHRIFSKVTLFLVIFVLAFHLPHFSPGLYNRQKMIEEILEVLERHPVELANVTKKELAQVIYEEAVRYNHDPKFILALIAIESSFQNGSVSEKGAKGLMQIMPYVAESLAQELGIEWNGDQTLFNPFLNIKMGSYYLSRLIRDFEDLGVALIAYNYGPTYVRGRIEKRQRIPHNYYHRVLNYYQTI